MKDMLNLTVHQLCVQRKIIEEYAFYRTTSIEKILEIQACLISIGAPKFSYSFKVKEIPGYIHELRWFHTKNQDETKNWYMTYGYKKENALKFIYDKPENLDLLGLLAFLDGLLYYFNFSISLVESWNEKRETKNFIGDIDVSNIEL